MKKFYVFFLFIVCFFNVGFSQNCNLTCVSKVNVSLIPNDCKATLSPYNFITDPSAISPTCQAYILKFEYPYGTNQYSPANKLDLSHQGYSMVYKVIDSVSKNSCWGTVKVNTCNPCAIPTPPTVTSFTTSAGPYIPGSTITLYASATDNKSISKIEFYSLGTLIGTDYTAPYQTKYKFDSLYASVHYFKAIAYDNCGDTASSEVIKIKTTFPACNDGYWNGNEKGKDCGGDCPACPMPCTVPTYLTAHVYGSDVTLSWNGTTAQYSLEIVNTETYQTVVSTSYITPPYHISLPDGSYKFRVKSKCGYETSDWSYYKYFVVDHYHPVCNEPLNLSYSIYGSDVKLTWTGNVSQYHLEVKNTSTNVIIVSDLHATSPYHLYNLPNGYYSFRVKSICYPHYSDWSASVSFAIHDYHPNPQPCYTPTHLVTNVVGDDAHLSWAGNASQYQLQIEDADTYNSIVSVYLDNTYFKTNLVHGNYRWRVRCVCHGAYIDWSSWKTFSIHYYPGPPPCDPPHHLSSSVSDNEVNMNWIGSASEYEIELHQIESQDIHTYNILGNSYMSMHMGHGSYKFKVKCHCSAQHSDWSEWSSFIVTADDTGGGDPKPLPCEKLHSVSVTSFNEDVKLSWSGWSETYFLELEALNGSKSVSLDISDTFYNTSLKGGEYKFRVKNKCDDLENNWTAWTYFTIDGGTSPAILPIVDSNCTNVPALNLTYVGDSILTLRWSPLDLHTVYSIEIKSEYAPVQYMFKVDGYRDSVIRVNGLIPNTQYVIRFASDCGNGGSHKIWTLRTVTLSKLPTAEETVSKLSCIKPSGTQVRILSSTKAYFTWLNVPRGRNYFVEIKSQEGTADYNKTITLNYLNEYEVNDLEAGGSYTFRVDAECYFSKSGYSNLIRFTMPAELKDIVQLESRSNPESLDFKIFPNPARSNVLLLFDGSMDHIDRVQILNIHGQLVMDLKKSVLNQINRIELDKFNRGVYFIKAWSDRSRLIKKLIVE